MGIIRGEYSVAQFFIDGTNEYVRRFVSAEEAVKAFTHYAKSVGAQMGTTVRVILTDGDDCINWEWQYGKGITYPTAEDFAKEAAKGDL